MLPNEILGGFSTGSDRLAARLLVSFFLFFLSIKVRRSRKAALWIMRKKNSSSSATILKNNNLSNAFVCLFLVVCSVLEPTSSLPVPVWTLL